MTISLLSRAAITNKYAIEKAYIQPLQQHQVTTPIHVFNLVYDKKKQCSQLTVKFCLDELLFEIQKTNTKYLLIADATYFKTLTKIQATKTYGEPINCVYPGYEEYQCFYIPNYQAAIYNPNLQVKIDFVLDRLSLFITKSVRSCTADIIHSANYPTAVSQIQNQLQELHKYKQLTCDIETKGLKFYNCGLYSIGFAWNKHEGTSFLVDYSKYRIEIRELLKTFFNEYQGELIFHNASFDVKVLIYQLFMEDLADYTNMIKAIKLFQSRIHDTKLIAYLSLNNTIQTQLGLKDLAQPFTGNYALENITDIDKIPIDTLLQYNLIDCLATWYVHETYTPIMQQDQQEDIYQNLYQPALGIIIQMELTGMPICMKAVSRTKHKLEQIRDTALDFFKTSQLVQNFHIQNLKEKAKQKTLQAKQKVYEYTDPVIFTEFNPQSPKQLQALIYDYLQYPVFNFTKTKLPATDNKTLEGLVAQARTPEHKQLFTYLIEHHLTEKLLTSFIPAFEAAVRLPDGSYRLYGNFNLGGAKSGRLSSSKVNLQQIPSTSKYSKIIKECFISPLGWIFVGSDFNSLEDKINALITNDPNKQKVYTDHYDGHSLRAFSYFKDKLVGIVDTRESINSIAQLYPQYRQLSKAPTFALTYSGTYKTLINQCGFSAEEALNIEASYHNLYKVADKWVQDKLTQAQKDGYVTCAFGLRLRTPILAQVNPSAATLPFIAESEKRSAGNAVSGQSYGLLTLRAGIEFQQRVYNSPYIYDILPVAHIHDAIYLLIRDRIGIVEWVNKNLLECMAWQELPELQHPIIKIDSELEMYWPNWSNKISIPPNATRKQLRQIVKPYKQKESA